MARTRTSLALLLCLAGGALSLILLSKHYGVPLLGEAVLAACGEGGGCDVVSQSRYAMFLGLPLAAWGLLFYGSLLTLLAPSAFTRTEEAPDSSLSLGFAIVCASVAIDVVLFGLQIAVIKAFCKFCIATYFVNLLLIALLWPYRQFALALNFLFTQESRRPLVAWVMATVAVGAAAFAGNAALMDRKTLAGTSILGIPMTLQAPHKTEPGSVEAQLEEARAEAKKWKETLDDEKKLQLYLNQKGRDDFNKTEVTKLDLSRAPSQGPKGAPIVVVSYSDFMCPFCRDLAAALKNYLPTTSEQIKVQYKHFPLDLSCNTSIGQTMHPGACQLSLGGICAEQSGRFWEYHDKVFAQRWDRATREDVLRIGASVGLEGAKLGSCMDAAATKGLLVRDIEEGSRVGVGSTPTIFVNGRKLTSTGVFLLAIDEERKRLNLSPPGGAQAPRPN
jgi:protein-disulfide isomerase/uncharacterized membrane protein